ncbi:hypothetical protein VTN00DRAFT_1923 [Thermoascus crustaceus]|uniref:uncharacterized protein n=1 Tax=Thermoascus crustaceus TaxID=5088 RepID=UPI00374307CA
MDLIEKDGSVSKEERHEQQDDHIINLDLEMSFHGSIIDVPGYPSTNSSNESIQQDRDSCKESTDPKGTALPTVRCPEDENVHEVSWDSPSDPANPLNWPFWIRCLLIVLVSASTFLTGLCSGFFAPVVPSVMAEFGSTNAALGSFVVTVFVLGLAAGPLVFAPLSELYGRLIVQHTGNISAITLPSFIFFRETYAPVLLERKASHLRQKTGDPAFHSQYASNLTPRAHFKRGITRAMKMLAFSPIVLVLSTYMGLVYSYFYLLITTLSEIFRTTYDFSPSISRLTYLGIGVGFLFAQIFFAYMSDRILRRMRRSRKEEGGKDEDGEMKPEYRLPLTVIGGVLMPIGFFWYGWSAQAKMHWIMPLAGTAILGYGNALIFMSLQTYHIDAFTIHAASAIAANTVIRSIMAGVLPLAAPRMYEVLGIGWGNTLLGILGLVLVPVPYLLLTCGEGIRKRGARKLMERL